MSRLDIIVPIYKYAEIPFEAQGISLSQALVRAGGLLDTGFDARGRYVLRLTPEDALPAGTGPRYHDTKGRVPVAFQQLSQ